MALGVWCARWEGSGNGRHILRGGMVGWGSLGGVRCCCTWRKGKGMDCKGFCERWDSFV